MSIALAIKTALPCPSDTPPNSECIAKMVAILMKPGGFRGNYRELLSHAIPFFAYYIAQFFRGGDDSDDAKPNPDDGFVMMATDASFANEMLALHDALQACPECEIEPPPMSGLVASDFARATKLLRAIRGGSVVVAGDTDNRPQDYRQQSSDRRRDTADTPGH